MTRELPFDDDAEAGDHANDAAYHVATGVARVARAGAYVTGGALIVSNGAPAPENESHNSHMTGWSTVDPDPEVPSPVVTYPDPAPDSVPPDLGTSWDSHAAFAPEAAVPGSVLPDPYITDAFPAPQLPFTHGEQSAPGLNAVPSTSDGGSTPPPFSIPGTDPNPGAHQGFDIPGSGAGQGFSLPGMHSAAAQPGLGLPGSPGLGGAQSGDSVRADESTAENHGGFGLPGVDTHPTAPLGGHGLGLPGTQGLDLPGMNGLGPGGLGLGDTTSGDYAGAYDGVGDAGHPGIFLGTEVQVDAHIGVDGIWLTTETTVDFAVGDVGDQLDEYGQWLGSGTQQIPGAGAASADAPGSLPGAAGSAQNDNPVAGGIAAGTGGAAANSGVAHAASGTQSAAVSGQSAAVAPHAAPVAAPVAPAPSMPAPQPVSIAPVAPAPAPPPPPAPPVPVGPVVATPLQTTIQPEVATHPVANVFTAHAGPSPLTAPAAAVPALFDYGPPTTPDAGDGAPELPGTDSDQPSGSTTVSTTEAPTTHTTTTPHTSTTHGSGHPSTTPSGGHSSVVAPTGEPSTTRPGTTSGHDSTGHSTPSVTTPSDSDSGHTTRTPDPTTSHAGAGSDSGEVTTPRTTGPDSSGTSGPTATHSPGTSAGADTSAPGNAGQSPAPTHDSPRPGHGNDSGPEDNTGTGDSSGPAPQTQPQHAPTQHAPTQDAPTQHAPTQHAPAPTHAPTVPTAQHTVAPVPGNSGMPAHQDPPTVVTPPAAIDPGPDAQLPVTPAAHLTDSSATSLWHDHDAGLTAVAATGLTGGLYDSAGVEPHHYAAALWHDPTVHLAADPHLVL